MFSNFSVLEPEWETLALIGRHAEINLFTDPNTTLIKLRVLGEMTAKLILKEEQLEYETRKPQFDIINSLKQQDIIPKEIEDLFHSIRIIGNRASHEMYTPSSDEAEIYLSMALKLCAWFKEVYGTDLSFDSENIKYRTPQKYIFTSDYENIKQENERLIREFKELREENKSLRTKPDKKIISFKSASKIIFNEKETRKIIDNQLRAVGWEVDSENLTYAKGVRPQKGRNLAISEWNIENLRADYALFNGLKFVGLIEAKKKSSDIISVLDESKMYSEKAKILGEESFVTPLNRYKVPFMFAANGREYNKIIEEKSGIWFFDGRKTTNLPKALKDWFSPRDLEELLEQKDISETNIKLENESFDYLESKEGLNLKYYQVEAIKEVEKALINGQKNILLTMATGTGKTRTSIALIYRLIKTQRFKRILFVVDRSSLGEQANDSFEEAVMEDLQTFTSIYDTKGIGDKFPDNDTKLHIATIQGLVRRIIYTNDNEIKPSVGQYDCIIVDEAHRGYILDKEMTEEETDFKNQNDYLSKYKKVLDYFEAVKIGLTATPALHTVQIFGNEVYSYPYEKAVVDGNLVDHDAPYIIRTELNTNGINWKAGDEVAIYNRGTQQIEKQVLNDELQIEIEGFNRKAITPEFNKTIAKELVKYIDPESEEKTLIFAVTDEHADTLVKELKREFKELGYELDDTAIKKITGYLKKEQGEAVKRFKNERLPNIVVTVDLLTTGIDVPEICNIVFVRRVKSRILYEQMIGRATRLCEKIGKTHFKIFDCVGLCDSFKDLTDIKPVVKNPDLSFETLISEFNDIKTQSAKETQRDQILAKIQRKKATLKKQEFEEVFKIKAGDLTPEEYIQMIRNMPVEDSIKKMLDDIELFAYLDTVKGLPPKQYISDHKDTVTEVKRGYGKDNKKPDDYLKAFREYISTNQDKIDALTILKTSPSKITRKQLKELELILSEHDFPKTYLNSALGEVKNENIMANIVDIIKNAISDEPIMNHADRVKITMSKIRHKRTLNPLQKRWLDTIEKHLLKEDIMQKEDFDKGAFKNQGGFKKVNDIFDNLVL